MFQLALGNDGVLCDHSTAAVVLGGSFDAGYRYDSTYRKISCFVRTVCTQRSVLCMLEKDCFLFPPSVPNPREYQ